MTTGSKSKISLISLKSQVSPIKFQSIAVSNGLIANFYGLLEGKRHFSNIS